MKFWPIFLNFQPILKDGGFYFTQIKLMCWKLLRSFFSSTLKSVYIWNSTNTVTVFFEFPFRLGNPKRNSRDLGEALNILRKPETGKTPKRELQDFGSPKWKLSIFRACSKREQFSGFPILEKWTFILV